MKSIFRIGLALLAGAIVGVIVLGIFGRLTFSVLAVVAGQPLNFSVMGVFEVLIISAIIGALGGGLFLLLINRHWFTRVVSGLISGLILFIFSVAVFTVIGVLYWGTPIVLFTVFLSGLLFVIYGMGIDLVTNWFGVNPRKNL